jgi:hypothetical protein
MSAATVPAPPPCNRDNTLKLFLYIETLGRLALLAAIARQAWSDADADTRMAGRKWYRDPVLPF